MWYMQRFEFPFLKPLVMCDYGLRSFLQLASTKFILEE